MKVHVHSYYRDPTDGLIVALKGDLDGMFSLPALGHRIQDFYNNGRDVTALIDIYDQMRTMNQYGLPDINDFKYGKVFQLSKPYSPTLDLFNTSASVR